MEEKYPHRIEEYTDELEEIPGGWRRLNAKSAAELRRMTPEQRAAWLSARKKRAEERKRERRARKAERRRKP